MKVLSDDPDIADPAIRALAVAVIAQACRDALYGSSEAYTWLHTVALNWLEALGHEVTREDLDRFLTCKLRPGWML